MSLEPGIENDTWIKYSAQNRDFNSCIEINKQQQQNKSASMKWKIAAINYRQ